MRKFKASPFVENQIIIEYQAFRHANFHLRMDVINIFQNVIQFLGKPNNNPNTHLLWFLIMYSSIENPSISSDAS